MFQRAFCGLQTDFVRSCLRRQCFEKWLVVIEAEKHERVIRGELWPMAQQSQGVIGHTAVLWCKPVQCDSDSHREDSSRRSQLVITPATQS